MISPNCESSAAHLLPMPNQHHLKSQQSVEIPSVSRFIRCVITSLLFSIPLSAVPLLSWIPETAAWIGNGRVHFESIYSSSVWLFVAMVAAWISLESPRPQATRFAMMYVTIAFLSYSLWLLVGLGLTICELGLAILTDRFVIALVAAAGIFGLTNYDLRREPATSDESSIPEVSQS